jgi:hypothetical protein
MRQSVSESRILDGDASICVFAADIDKIENTMVGDERISIVEGHPVCVLGGSRGSKLELNPKRAPARRASPFERRVRAWIAFAKKLRLLGILVVEQFRASVIFICSI